MKKGFLLLGTAVFAMLLCATASLASLGEMEDSIESDRSSISGRRGSPRTRAGYTIHELVADGVTVREFADPSGVVFGVAWNGVSTPDLTRLLGSYSSECEDAEKGARIPGRRSLAVQTGSVILERWGHMRNLQGRAYMPSLVPEGVNVDEIR